MASTGAIAAKLDRGMKALKAAAERITEAVPEAPALKLPEWRDADYERAEQMEALGQWLTGLADLVAPVEEAAAPVEVLTGDELPPEGDPPADGMPVVVINEDGEPVLVLTDELPTEDAAPKAKSKKK
jgi:hypothetical protein